MPTLLPDDERAPPDTFNKAPASLFRLMLSIFPSARSYNVSKLALISDALMMSPLVKSFGLVTGSASFSATPKIPERCNQLLRPFFVSYMIKNRDPVPGNANLRGCEDRTNSRHYLLVGHPGLTGPNR